MSDSIEPDHSASAAHSPTDFEKELVALCGVLEQWRAERKTAEKLEPDDYPRFNWRALLYSVCLLVLAKLILIICSYLNANSIEALLLSFVALSFSAAAVLLIFPAIGLGTRKSWRTLIAELRNKDNYPFDSLLKGLRTDFSASNRLQPFSTNVLSAAQERIILDETELKERLTSVIGSPSMLTAFGLCIGIWTTWKDFHAQMNTATWLILFGTIAAFVLAAQGFRLRISLFELTRCRALLSLEIARRNAATPH